MTHVMAVGLLAAALWVAGADTVTLPFLAANYSDLDITFAHQADSALRQRRLEFSAPGGFVADPASVVYEPLGTAGMLLNWPTVRQTSVTAPDGVTTAHGSANAWTQLTAMVWPMTSVDATPEEAVADVFDLWIASGGALVSAAVPQTMAMDIEGGAFDAVRLTLHGASAVYRNRVAGSDSLYEAEDLVVALDWGVDAFGTRTYLVIVVETSGMVGSSNPSLLPLEQVAATLTGGTLTAYNQSVISAYRSQIASQTCHLAGAAPDWLIFYDFSKTPAAGLLGLVPEAVREIDPTTLSLQHLYPYIDQYDAGEAFGLPQRGANPHPDSSGYTPGGNACGPVSLAAALTILGQTADTAEVYDNTMQLGLGVPPDTAQAFLWQRSRDWLVRHTSQHPRLLQHGEGPRLEDDWAAIDAFLGAGRPVLLRTDLTLSFTGATPAAPRRGMGHVILLLGLGHSDYVRDAYGQLYGTGAISGDYYVVLDPAGHYYANPGGSHYSTIEELRRLAIGVSYGGAGAIYPRELLRGRITDQSASGAPNVMRALLFGAANYAAWTVHSPVALRVTAPTGEVTGAWPDGATATGIPASEYQVEVGDEELDGGPVYPADGPTAVVVDMPAAGTYRVDLTGTGSGPYRLEFEVIGADGALVGAVTKSGTVTDGTHVVYGFDTTGAEASLGPAIATLTPLPAGRLGTAYHLALAASGGRTPYTWAVVAGALPPGLSLGTDGAISGTPTAAATDAGVTVEVTDRDGLTASRQFSLTVAPATLTVTALDRSRLCGESNPSFPLSYAGFVNGDTVADVAVLPTATCVADAASPAGTYPIVPAGGVDPDYEFVYVNGTLTVSADAPGPVPPTGEFVAALDAAGVLAGHGLWNLSGSYVTTLAGYPLGLSLEHDGKGKLTGTAVLTLSQGTSCAVPVKGSARGAGGVVTVTLALKGSNPTKTASVSLALALTLAPGARQLTGAATGSVRDGATTVPVSSASVTLDVPAPMDGTWTLRFVLQAAKAVTGQATLALSNGVTLRYAVKGKLAGSAVVLSLAGDAADPLAKAVKIKTTVVPLSDGSARLQSFSAKGYGQALLW